jgi:hypothetical protein
MATVEFDPQPLQAYATLEKAGAETLLDAIDDALDTLEADPGNVTVRRRSFGDGLWGIPSATAPKTGSSSGNMTVPHPT